MARCLEEKVTLKCRICGELVKDLVSHVKLQHKLRRNFFCTMCGVQFKTKVEKDQHMKQKHKLVSTVQTAAPVNNDCLVVGVQKTNELKNFQPIIPKIEDPNDELVRDKDTENQAKTRVSDGVMLSMKAITKPRDQRGLQCMLCNSFLINTELALNHLTVVHLVSQDKIPPLIKWAWKDSLSSNQSPKIPQSTPQDPEGTTKTNQTCNLDVRSPTTRKWSYPCHRCSSFKTANKLDLLKHLSLDHGLDLTKMRKRSRPSNSDKVEVLYPYACKICKFVSLERDAILDHFSKKHNIDLLKKSPLFLCHQCPFKSADKAELAKHATIVHEVPKEPVMLPCRLCSFNAKDKVALENHMRGFHKLLQAKKSPSRPTDDTKRIIRCHNKKRHLENPKQETKFEHVKVVNKFGCNKCDFVGQDGISLAKHVKLKHSIGKGMNSALKRCNSCNFVCLSDAELRSHMWDRHNIKQDQENLPFKIAKVVGNKF